MIKKIVASEVVDADSDDDVVEILSSDDEEEGGRELSAEDEEHYSYSDEDEQEEGQEFEQYPDGQHVILYDDDDDDADVGHSKEPRWVDELDEAYHTRHERHHHNYSEELREIEAAQEDSQDDDAVEVEDDDVVEEEYDDDEDVTGEHQVEEDEEDVSPEELRHQRNEMNRQRRGQMGMNMGVGISNALRFGKRHPLGPMEPVDLGDGEDDEIVEGVSDEEGPEGMDECDNREPGEVIGEGEEYPSDEEPFNGDEEIHRDGATLRELYDDGPSSEGEPEVDMSLPQPHQQRASLSHHLQENLRHLESAMPPQERYDSPTGNVVMLLDSDEEEGESPQDDSEAEDGDAEREELEYDSDSQHDQEEEYEQDQEDKYDQPVYTTQDDNTWEDDQNADPEKINDVPGSHAAVADSVIQSVGEMINRNEYALGAAESLVSQESQDPYEQLRTFTSSTSSSGSTLFQSHVSDNDQLNLDTDQNDMDGDVVREVIEAGAHRSSPNVVQDEEMQSQPASPAEEYEVEQQSRYTDSGDGLGGYDTVIVTDSPRLVDVRNDPPLTDVVMTETPGYQGLPSAPVFESGTDADISQVQFEERTFLLQELLWMRWRNQRNSSRCQRSIQGGTPV